jgi:hypothetical protein
MERFAMMKKMMLAVVFKMTVFHGETCEYRICNESEDSFMVAVSAHDPRAVITQLIENSRKMTKSVDPLEIEGRMPEMCGRDVARCRKLYKVEFKDGYSPAPGNEPFISFRNHKAEFKLVFFDESYVELRSDTASEIHDDPKRCEYDHSHAKDEVTPYGCDICSCNVRHWMVFGQYIAVCCYEREHFPRRCIDIYQASNDNSWIKSVKEVDFDLYLGFSLPPQLPENHKQHWWSRLSCCYSCCTD